MKNVNKWFVMNSIRALEHNANVELTMSKIEYLYVQLVVFVIFSFAS
jgi:hypothetical protein